MTIDEWIDELRYGDLDSIKDRADAIELLEFLEELKKRKERESTISMLEELVERREREVDGRE